MRFATGGFIHEANTFAPVKATLAHCEAKGILLGDEIADAYRGTHHTLGGYFALAEMHEDVSVTPLIYGLVGALGTMTSDAFERYSDGLIDLLERDGPWDGVLLHLHGSCVAEGFRDADGEVVARVRETVGSAVPIAVSMDMHANVSPALVESADVVNAYMTTPHVDARERGLEAADILYRTVKGEVRPTMALEKPPVIIDITRMNTDEHPMKALVERAISHAKNPAVLSVSVLEGFPWADVESMGMGFLAVTDGDEALASEIAGGLATAAWELRDEFIGIAPLPIDEAIRRANTASSHPVGIIDLGDNIGAGAPGDGTELLAEAQRAGVTGLFQTVCDPAAVELCVSAGVGEIADLEVGHRASSGERVHIRGRVRTISDGRFRNPPSTSAGWPYFDTGPSVVVALDDGNVVLLTTLPISNISLSQLYSVGLDPREMRIIVIKGTNAAKGAYGSVTTELLPAATTGCATPDLGSFVWHHRRKPLFPIERDAAYEAAS